VIDELAACHGAQPALLSARETLSYAELAARVNRAARWALTHGLDGAAVALMMPNRPDYLATWLGLTKVGAVVALLNTNLAGAALAHCVAAAAPRGIIVAPELGDVVADALPHLAGLLPVWTFGRDLDLATGDGGPLGAAEQRPVTLSDRALCIYTSGTTGLPKAANVSHHRLMAWTHWFAGLTGAGPSDRMYNCLPMYHSVGGVVASGSVLVAGGSVVIAERFSARRFWDEVAQFDCTLFQYIGELCRYLLAAPPAEAERHHGLRLCVGNGLRPEVWEAFQARFAIPRILEFYAATEGNFSLYNVEGEPGAIGRIPPFLAHRFPVALVKFDMERGAPLRAPDGRCVPVARGEAGEAIGRISDDGDALSGRFEGYTGAAETEKKILRDVFAPGDAWFRTGDLMRQDERGFFRFVDRVGDTFRWKGENVATAEVAAAVASCPGVAAAVAYGVAVPGAEGRAGMAALVAEEGFDLAALRSHLAAHLPAYARPLFLRIVDRLDATETFKPKTHELAREGFDPAVVGDRLYMDDPAAGTYVSLDAALFARVAAGEMRL
jgi:fatty-acyl-CoA synthase